jgi:hypothetical protein
MAVQVSVAAPARQTRLGGIRAAATWVTNARIGAAEGVVYVSDGCSFPQPAIGLCFGETVVAEKSGVGIDQYSGIGEPFALYGGVECFIGPDSDFPDRARNILIQGEDRAIEARLATWAAAGTSVTGGNIAASIAAVEQEADQDYLGRPIILMSRANAVLAAAAQAIEYGIDGLPYTVNGTPVVASGAITANAIYAVGAVTVLRSDVETIDTINHTVNTEWAVAEAVYSVIVDCNFRIYATVTP